MKGIGLYINSLHIGRAYQFGLIVRQVTTVLVAVILAKSTLSIQEIGQYEQLMLLGYGLTAFWVESLSKGYLKVYHDLAETDKKDFTSQVSGLLLWLTVSAGVLSSLLISMLSLIYPGEGFPPAKWLVFACFIFLFQLSSLAEVIFLARGKTINLLAWTNFSLLGMGFFFLIPVWFSGHLMPGLYGLTGYGLCRFIWFANVSRPYVNISSISETIRRWLRLSAPLVVYGLLSGTVILADGFIITYWYNDPEVFAIYRYGARELPFAMVIAAGLEMISIDHINMNINKLRDLTKRTLYWFFPIAGTLMFISEWMFGILFNSNFSDSAVIFKIYLFILVSRFVLTTPLLTAKSGTKYILVVGIMEVLINIGLSLIFVGAWGIEGVAWATVIAFSFEKIAHLFILRKKWGISIKGIVPVSALIVYTALLMLCFWISY